MLIAILNQSKLVSDEDAASMTQAIAAQVRLDAAPLWDRAPAAVIFYTNPKDVPAAAHGIALPYTAGPRPSNPAPQRCHSGCISCSNQSRHRSGNYRWTN